MVSQKHLDPLSRQQILESYAPNTSVFTSMIRGLESKGFKVAYTSPDRFSVEVYASASTVESLFHTELYMYSYQGESYYAPLNQPSVPEWLRGVYIVGLTNRTLVQPQYIVLGYLNGSQILRAHLPRSTPSVGLSTAATYYGPTVLEDAYGVNTMLGEGYGGRGQSVAVIDAYGDPLIQQDIAQFDQRFGLPAANLTIVPVGPYHPEFGVFSGWDVETALDVEAVHTMAPYAHIYLVVGFNPIDLTDALFEAVDYVVSMDLANTTSMSWGVPENLFGQSGFYYSGFLNYPYADYYFALGAAEGISFFAASGDEGAYSGTPTTYGGPLFPATSPFVTAVGGTTLYVNVTSGSLVNLNAHAHYLYEEAWSVSPDYSGETVSSGGGYSTLFPRPWYQAAVDTSNYRSVPDVAADANPYTGFTVIVEGQKIIVGGTSLATPLWAGMTAILDQYMNTALGLLNPYLYNIYENSTVYSRAFHQIDFGYNGGYHAGHGYNLVTGLGSPDLPNLAAALKSMKPQLSVSVSLGGSGSNYPQFQYGSTVTVAATAAYPNSTVVTSGTFTAYVYDSEGEYTSVTLNYNGSAWVGAFTVQPGSPPNTWSIAVDGSSAGYTGVGAADMQVGLSVVILQPVPYPYGAPIAPNQPFTVAAAVTYPDGSPLINATVTAEFQYDGANLFNVTLLPVSGEPGVYAGSYALLPNLPQGAYIMQVYANMDGQVGEAYTYEYFGEALLGSTILTPTLDALPSASVGQKITLYTVSESPTGGGVFTSNVTAEFYYPSGTIAAKVQLRPAPNTVQYSLLNLFSAQEANYTIPANFSPGFYTVVFNSTYNGSSGLEHGYYTTALYVSPTTVGYHIYSAPQAFEGQTVQVNAEIYYANGTPVTNGIFMATLEPVNYNYLGLILEESTGVPMQYNSARGVWEANFTLPSILEGGFYTGLPETYLSGPWNIVLTGESVGAMQTQESYYYVDVLPYTYTSYHVVDESNVSKAALVTNSSGTAVLEGVGSQNLTLRGVSVTLRDDYIYSLTIVDSRQVTIVASKLGHVNIVDSNVTIIDGTVSNSEVGIALTSSNLSVLQTVFSNLSYAYSPANSTIHTQADTYNHVAHLSTIPAPLFRLKPTTITGAVNHVSIQINGSELSVVGVAINGVHVNYTVTPTTSGIILSVPFSSTAMPDGVYNVTVTVDAGLGYTQSFSLVNLYHEQLTDYVLGGLGVVGLIVAAVTLFLFLRQRRMGVAQ
jgi:subtilase family serine protease